MGPTQPGPTGSPGGWQGFGGGGGSPGYGAGPGPHPGAGGAGQPGYGGGTPGYGASQQGYGNQGPPSYSGGGQSSGGPQQGAGYGGQGHGGGGFGSQGYGAPGYGGPGYSAAANGSLPELAKSFVSRVAQGDLSRTELRPEEAAELSARGIHGAAARLAVWRRAMLGVGIVAYATATVFAAISWADALNMTPAELGMPGPIGDEVKATNDLLSTLLFLPMLAALGFLFQAFKGWATVNTSKRALVRAFACAFLPPFLLALVPWTATMDLSAAQAQMGDQFKQFEKMLGFIIALAFFMKIGPAIIGICSGVVRGSLVIKTLLPQSPWPAWAALLFGPLYALMILVVLLFLQQSSGGMLLLAALVALAAAPLIYLRRAREVMRPHTAEEVEAIINPIRKQAAMINGVGVLLLAIFLLEEVEELGLMDALGFLFGALSSAMLMTLFVADGLLGLIARGWEQDRAFQATPLVGELDATLSELRQQGAA